MKERQTDLVLWYTSSDTLYVYEIEEFVWEWKAFEAVRVKDESGIRTRWWTYKFAWTQLTLLRRSLFLERRTRSGWRGTISRPASGQHSSKGVA